MAQENNITKWDMFKVWARHCIPYSIYPVIIFPKYTYLSLKEDPTLKFLGTLIGNIIFLALTLTGIIALALLIYIFVHKNVGNKRQLFINRLKNYKDQF